MYLINANVRFFFSYRDANYDTANPSYIRKYLRTYGLTPPRAESYETQKTRCLAQLGLKDAPIDKFLYLQNLRKNNVHLFYRMVNDHLRVRSKKKNTCGDIYKAVSTGLVSSWHMEH